MELNISSTIRQFITALVLLILPLVTIGLGLVFNIMNAWLYILGITWFGFGVIFFSAMQQ